MVAMHSDYNRRKLLQVGVTALGAAAMPVAGQQPGSLREPAHFRFGLNTATLRGYQLGLKEQIELAAKAGYDAIEPWTADLARYAEAGGSLKDLGQRCRDLGIEVCGAIGFAQWIVSDAQQRAMGVEAMKRDMALVAELGGKRIAAPPSGANRGDSVLDQSSMAERYRVILDAGHSIGVVPQLEIWGSSINLNNLADAMAVAARAGHPDASLLADVYHLYKGGTAPAALRLLGRKAAHIFHMNDYPADPDRASITDAHRVWPGEGIAPLEEILGNLAANDCRVVLSVEVFNTHYWKQPVLDCARTGLDRMKTAVRSAGL
jgi:2-keto-myo-inositol isomerase